MTAMVGNLLAARWQPCVCSSSITPYGVGFVDGVNGRDAGQSSVINTLGQRPLLSAVRYGGREQTELLSWTPVLEKGATRFGGLRTNSEGGRRVGSLSLLGCDNGGDVTSTNPVAE